MDVAKLVVGILLAAAITFLAWVWLVDPCNPCVGGVKWTKNSGDCVIKYDGRANDGTVWQVQNC